MAIYYRGVGAIPQSRAKKQVLPDAGNPVKASPKEAPPVLGTQSSKNSDLSDKSGNTERYDSKGLSLTGASWVDIYAQLESASRYSVKTWQAYRHWFTAFQTFTKSKDPRLLTMEDVKGFLCFLAVEKQVAASTPLQTFR